MVIKMNVILAQNLGFCYGVKRAIKLARDSASPSVRTCTLGPIIHNPQMVAKLAAEGVSMLSLFFDWMRCFFCRSKSLWKKYAAVVVVFL